MAISTNADSADEDAEITRGRRQRMGNFVGIDFIEQIGGRVPEPEFAQVGDRLLQDCVVCKNARQSEQDEDERQRREDRAQFAFREKWNGQAMADGEHEREQKKTEQRRIDGEEASLLRVDRNELQLVMGIGIDATTMVDALM